MPENITRRKFLGWGISAVASTVVCGASTLPTFTSIQEVPPDIEIFTKLQSEKFANLIEFQGFEEPVQIGDRSILVHPNNQAFAETVIDLALIDGGSDEAEKTADYLKQSGLLVKTARLLPGQLGASNGLEGVFARPEISLNLEDIANYNNDSEIDEIFWHELFHTIQVTRNPVERVALFVPDGIAYVGTPFITYKLLKGLLNIDQIIMPPEEKPKALSRRNVITSGVAGMVGLLTYLLISPGIKPTEIEAYSKIYDITQKKLMERHRGTLFTIIEV